MRTQPMLERKYGKKRNVWQDKQPMSDYLHYFMSAVGWQGKGPTEQERLPAWGEGKRSNWSQGHPVAPEAELEVEQAATESGNGGRDVHV